MTYYEPSYYEPSPTYLHPIDTPLTARPMVLSEARPYRPDLVHYRMLMILVAVAVVVPLLTYVKPRAETVPGSVAGLAQVEAVAEAAAPGNVETDGSLLAGVSSALGAISPIFSAEVTHWEPQILAWSAQYGVDPDITAIIMQIESCGDPQAISRAGAQGLFQVMPFHFAAGEDSLDPDTNARRGLNYFVERLAQTKGDIGKAFAGYNGGHVAAGGSWDTWANETQRYYVWSTGLYADAKAGLATSPTLQQWMQAGGASLCRQAAARLGLASQ